MPFVSHDLPMLSLSVVCLCIWLVLTFARSGFWRFAAPDPPEDQPLGSYPDVVAIIPARDEAAHIGGCVSSLLRQAYPGRFKVIVVDDASTDGTGAAALKAAELLEASERLTVVNARTLPSGWSGKVWAQSEGMRALDDEAQPGDVPVPLVWFTDADIVHRPGVLSRLVVHSVQHKLVLNSQMVHLRCKSLAERTLVPAFVFFFAMLYPFAAVNASRKKTAAAAGGSMLIAREALVKAGGMAAIRGALIDDCALGALLKQQGPIQLTLGHESFSIRPYPGFRDIWNMVSRTAYTQLRYSPLVLAGTVVGLVVTYLAPPLLALTAVGVPAALGALAWALMVLCFYPITRVYRRSPAWGVALPGIATFYLAATLGSAWQHWRGRGGAWKDRHQGSALASTETLDQSR